MVQLFLVFFGLPKVGIVIEPMPAGIMVFSISIGAYSSEIFRAAILSIPKGQWEAAMALGMSYPQQLIRIILPQAFKIALPPLFNSFISLVKDTSLAANITIPEARLLVISVWDKSALKNVEKAILAANIGITPNNDGTVIRLVFPELTEERRKALVKELRQNTENCRVVLRNARRDAIDALKKAEKASTITEDDLKTFTADVEKALAKRIEDIEKLAKDKEQEILEV